MAPCPLLPHMHPHMHMSGAPATSSPETAAASVALPLERRRCRRHSKAAAVKVMTVAAPSRLEGCKGGLRRRLRRGGGEVAQIAVIAARWPGREEGRAFTNYEAHN